MQERIAVDPKVHFGKPCVAGTRIPVLNVLELVWEGRSFADIVADLQNAFVVVEPGRHRFRRLSQ